MHNWEQTLQLLLDSESTGMYQYCKVDQIILEDQSTKVGWNFFTHVTFSSEFTSNTESHFLCPPVTINSHLKLYIFQYQMDKEKFKECVRSAISSDTWSYTDSEKKAYDHIDNAFPTDVKFIAANDPIGSSYNNVIPIEMALYGSNFIGNYYIFEIYAHADNIKKLLSTNDLMKIQFAIQKKCKLNYQLNELTDRIGNVVCKFIVETLSVTPKRLGPYGMTYSFELDQGVKKAVCLHFHIEQEHDRLLYECTDEDIVLNPGEMLERGVDPNQCKTTMTVSDVDTALILFRAVSDQSIYSNYHGQISPDVSMVTLCTDHREVNLNGRQIRVSFKDIRMVEEPTLLIEMADAGKRQQEWEEKFLKEHKYLNVYKTGEHDRAIADIRSIINSYLLWDLQEIRIIDPYLSSKDILETVVFCEKRGIRICCLTDIHTISNNKEAKEEIIQEENDRENFDSIRMFFKEELEKGLGPSTDLLLSFRTVHGNNGISFHDRYLILKYGINTTRVWSLGTSVNSVGKSHHIIQIVESPILIDNFFEKVWNQTDTDECKIFDYSDYLSSMKA